MSVENLFSAIGTLGFPCVITIFMLVRLDASLKEMAVSINNLTISVNKLLVFKEKMDKNEW